MLRDITIGRYIDSDSPLHRTDPRTKIISTIIYSVSILMCNSLFSMLAAGIFTVTAIIIAEIPIKYILKGIKPLRWFLLFTFIVNLFTGDSNILINWGMITITYDGVYNAILITLKFILFTVGASLLTLTTSPVKLTDGFARLIKPLKILRLPTDDIAIMLSVTLRFIPTVTDEYERILKAQHARSFGLSDKGIIHKIKSASAMAVPLFISTFRRADELSLAMEARCYGNGTRKPRKKLKFATNDCVLSIIIILFCVFLAIIEFLD